MQNWKIGGVRGPLEYPWSDSTTGGKTLDQGYILKIDDDGEFLWNVKIRDSKNVSIEKIICQRPDKFIVAGNLSLDGNITGYMIKGDTKGFDWTNDFPGDVLYDFIEVPPGFLAAGESKGKGVVLRISEYGNVQGRRLVNSVSRIPSIESVDDGFIATGNDPNTSEMALVRLTDDARVVWTKTYSEKGKAKDVVQDYLGFVTVGNAKTHSTLIRTDKNGKELWKRQYPQEITCLRSMPGGCFTVGNLKGDIVSAHIDYKGATSYSNTISGGNLAVSGFVGGRYEFLIAGSRNNQPYLAKISPVGKTGSLTVVE